MSSPDFTQGVNESEAITERYKQEHLSVQIRVMPIGLGQNSIREGGVPAFCWGGVSTRVKNALYVPFLRHVSNCTTRTVCCCHVQVNGSCVTP